MRPQNPGANSSVLDVLKSFFKVFSGNVSIGNANAFDSNGNGTTFNRDNTDGVIVRQVGWGTANTPVVITHNLARRPIGYLVISKTVSCDVYSGGPMLANTTTITLSCTSATADTTLYIF